MEISRQQYPKMEISRQQNMMDTNTEGAPTWSLYEPPAKYTKKLFGGLFIRGGGGVGELPKTHFFK